MKRTVLFVQNRTHRAGAQTCLARLLRHELIKQWNPVLVCSPGGWLVEECKRIDVPVIEEQFPSSRSLPVRLFGNAIFARRVCARLAERSISPTIIQANDHQEGLLGLEIGERLGAQAAIFLRSPTMTRRDFYKYRCDRYGFISAVGDEFRDRVQSWIQSSDIALIRDGIFADEIGLPKTKPFQVPSRVLVIGSPLGWKGWADLTEALFLLEQGGALPPMQFDFTGVVPDPAENNLKLARLGTARCNFLGRVEAFRDLVLSYDLVINPSRMETFGLAAIEVLAAGVPLLSSRTGVIEQVQENQRLLFIPSSPESLAAALRYVLEHWDRVDFGIARSQELIRERFLIDRTVVQLNAAYERLQSQRPGQPA